MRIKFWGVRGSTPTPERRNSRYGGNTACIEVRLANGTLIILDCGSGLRGLGKSLLREFGTHPIHVINPYFPVDMSAMGAVRHFYDLDKSPIDLNGATIRSAPLNHPQECVGYRIEADGGAFVLATDTEPGSAYHDRSVRELAQGAEVLVYDAQYTPEQLRGEKKGWGHSSWLEGARVARECGIKRLILFHHDPDNDDAFVDGLVEKAQQEFPSVHGASEGVEIKLPQGAMTSAEVAEASNRRRSAAACSSCRSAWAGVIRTGEPSKPRGLPKTCRGRASTFSCRVRSPRSSPRSWNSSFRTTSLTEVR